MDALSLFVAFLTNPSFHYVFLWWGAWSLLGPAFLPLTMRLFRGFDDKGYFFARVLGLLLSAYSVWLVSSLGVAPFTRAVSFAAVALGAVANYAIPGSLKKVRALFKEHRRDILLQEYLFLAALLLWAFVRTLQPDINGLEKFMDYGFVNASLRAEWMPPADMWLAGKTINYYYFGHYFTAFLCRLTGIPTDVAYNLMIASLFALAFVLSYSIVSNMLRRAVPSGLKKSIAGGLLAAFLLAFGGNLHPFLYGVAPHILHRAGLRAEAPAYWYPDATRFIGHRSPEEDKTIHEFPFYSFVVSDLHGHVLDIPVVLTVVGAGASLLMGSSPYADPARAFRLPLLEASVAGLLLGVAWMTNTWDYPIYLLVLFGVFLVHALRRRGFSLKALGEFAAAAFVTVVVSQASVVPYNNSFEQFTQGVHRVLSTSPLWQMAVLWGYQLFFVAAFALFLFLASPRLLAERGEEGRLTSLLRGTPPSDVMALGMAAAAVGLLIIPELVYVKDIYGKSFHRANTMFKLTYQAFMLFALVAGYAALRIVGALQKRPKACVAAALLFAAVAAMPLTYPAFAIPGFYPRPSLQRYKWLHGLEFMNTADREIVRWFEENVHGSPVVLEADGDSYSYFGRISMATGLPTPLGWYVHEWLWRGGTEELDRRRRDVMSIYTSDDLPHTLDLVRAYGIRYIVAGSQEREKFRDIKEDKLKQLGRVVLRVENSLVLEIAAP